MRSPRVTRLLRHSWLVLLLLADSPSFPQVGPYPGGYPPGRYPGGGYPGGGGIGFPRPRRGKNKKTTDSKQDQAPLQQHEGILRKVDESSVVLEPRDSRILVFKRSEKTKFFKDGEESKPSDLKPGDHLLVEATQDQEGFLYAVNVTFQKEGTAEERAAASQPVQVSPVPEDEKEGTAQSRDTQARAPGDDDDRPRLKRADPETPRAETPPPRAETPASRTETPSRGDARSETETPVAPPANSENTQVSQNPPPINPDDPGPPRLKRARPQPRTRAQSVEVADARIPPARAEPNPVAARPGEVVPEPEPPRKDPVIEKARGMAGSFTETLPNYVCQEMVARFVNIEHITNWRPLDVVSAEVVYENGRERYRNLKINGKPTKQRMEELPGAWSTGEFGTALVDVVSPSTAADFRFRKDSRIAGMSAVVYDFTVERETSHWRVQVPSQFILPAYKGSMWIDKQNARVLRIEMQARNLPEEFPLDKVESAIDYEYVRISDRQFLLPVHAETLSCQRGTNTCSRNTIDFRNYHKYSGEANITFEK